MNSSYMVKPVNKDINISIEVPGSKSITNRALLLAGMANGTSRLRNVLFSDDSVHFMECLNTLGYPLVIDEDKKEVTITGHIPNTETTVYVGSAGTAARFITALLASYPGEFEITASEQMQRRPMKPLFDGLKELGSQITFMKNKDSLPVKIKGAKINGGNITIDASKSSQFISALLMTGLIYKDGLNLSTTGQEISKSYTNITLRMIEEFGGSAKRISDGVYRVEPAQFYSPRDYFIEPDVSAACYFYAMPMLTGGSALVKGVHFDSMQGDIEFLKILELMGAELTETEEGVILKSSGEFNGGEFNLNNCSDQTMTLAALAPFAKDTVIIKDIEHIKYQESNRVKAILTELGKMGVDCGETKDGIYINPSVPNSSNVETYDDHRMAMAFSLIGLRTEGINILNPGCTSKTFKEYFDIFSKIN